MTYDIGNPGSGLGQAQKYRTIVLAIDQENGRYDTLSVKASRHLPKARVPMISL
jgi:hypothetical protein